MRQSEIDLIIHTTMQYLSMAKNNIEDLRCRSGVGRHLRDCLYDSPVRNINFVMENVQKIGNTTNLKQNGIAGTR